MSLLHCRCRWASIFASKAYLRHMRDSLHASEMPSECLLDARKYKDCTVHIGAKNSFCMTVRPYRSCRPEHTDGVKHRHRAHITMSFGMLLTDLMAEATSTSEREFFWTVRFHRATIVVSFVGLIFSIQCEKW